VFVSVTEEGVVHHPEVLEEVGVMVELFLDCLGFRWTEPKAWTSSEIVILEHRLWFVSEHGTPEREERGERREQRWKGGRGVNPFCL
jgi:hypothetical protein